MPMLVEIVTLCGCISGLATLPGMDSDAGVR
jgi:hypothetical protein